MSGLAPLIASVSTLLCLSACGATAYQPAAERGFSLEPAGDVSEAMIAAALAGEAEADEAPLPEQARVAYFTFDRRRGDALRPTLAKLPGVTGIAQLTLDQDNPHEAPEMRARDYVQRPSAVSVRKLRLLAARAGCRVLVIADHGHRSVEEPNAWVMSSVLVLPIFFAPMVDLTVESYLDVYVLDVQSGRTIAVLREDHIERREGKTLFHEAPTAILDAQWTRLRSSIEDQLRALFSKAAEGAEPEPEPEPEPESESESGPDSDTEPAPDPFSLPVDPEAG